MSSQSNIRPLNIDDVADGTVCFLTHTDSNYNKRYLVKVGADRWHVRAYDDGRITAGAKEHLTAQRLVDLGYYYIVEAPKPYDNNDPYGIDKLLGQTGQFGVQTHDGFRKDAPVYEGFIKYFPNAIVAVANLSKVANEQHHPGTPVHWDKSKSTDELNALMSHVIKAVALDDLFDDDGIRHATKIAWRAMANLEREIEAARKKD